MIIERMSPLRRRMVSHEAAFCPKNSDDGQCGAGLVIFR